MFLNSKKNKTNLPDYIHNIHKHMPGLYLFLLPKFAGQCQPQHLNKYFREW